MSMNNVHLLQSAQHSALLVSEVRETDLRLCRVMLCAHSPDAAVQVRITVKQPWRTVTRQAIRDMSKEEFRELYNVSVRLLVG